MGARVVARSSGTSKVEVTNGAATMVLDLSKADAGGGLHLGPHEALLAALGGCTIMTLRGYAARKGWPLEGVEVALTQEKPAAGAGLESHESIGLDFKLMGPLDAEQKARLLEIAQKCPVRKTLLDDLAFHEKLLA